MIGSSLSAMLEGIEGTVVRVEADVSPGIPQFHIVGLPDSSVRESKLRIRAALKNSGLEFPYQRITVNLSPASVRKHGAGLDLPIAIAILRASGQIPAEVGAGIGFCAELGLNGSLIPVDAIINLALGLRQAGVRHVVASAATTQHLPIPDVTWYLFPCLADVVTAIRQPSDRLAPAPAQACADRAETYQDINDVVGHDDVKRSLTIAAIGRHHVLLTGPPGSGKTMLAERYGTILPPLSEIDRLQVFAIHQAASLPTPPSLRPPVRMPHHTLTASGMIGGTTQLLPGEVTLAHRGVLIVDELLEFSRPTLESLREPLAHGSVRLHRGGRTVTYPADFQFIGTLNPCPCGKRGFGDCHCRDGDVQRYWSRLSGALSDRMDMTLPVRQSAPDSGTSARATMSVHLQGVIAAARLRRSALVSESGTAPITAAALRLHRRAAQAWSWSNRGSQSVLAVATSVCALEACDRVELEHLEEAVALRGHVHPSNAPRT